MMTEWRKAQASGTGGCVEVKPTAYAVLVREDRNGPYLRFTHDEWAAFLTGVKNGEFDLPT